MQIAIKYNRDLAFRRRVAFYRTYRAKDFQKRFAIEMIALAVSALATLAMWLSGSGAHSLVYVFFFTAVSTVYFLVRVLRAGMIALRVKAGDGTREERTFYFDERGFSFGPVDAAGKMIETNWRDVDRVYLTSGTIYVLAMGRRHWAAVDRRLIVEGTWEELISLVRGNLPKRLITG
jgi:hypothetical protein